MSLSRRALVGFVALVSLAHLGTAGAINGEEMSVVEFITGCNTVTATTNTTYGAGTRIVWLGGGNPTNASPVYFTNGAGTSLVAVGGGATLTNIMAGVDPEILYYDNDSFEWWRIALTVPSDTVGRVYNSPTHCARAYEPSSGWASLDGYSDQIWSSGAGRLIGHVFLYEEPPEPTPDTPSPLFGANGTVYAGNRTATAAAMRVSETGLSALYGLFFIGGLAITGFSITRNPWGAGAGGIGGLILALVFGFIPVWFVAFVAVVLAALFLLIRGRGET